MTEAKPDVDSSVLIWLGIATTLGVVFVILYFINQSSNKHSPLAPHASPLAPRGAAEAAGPVRRRRAMHVNRRQADEEDYDVSDDEPEGLPLVDEDGKKIGAKKLRKLEMKAEKREARQQEADERDERKQRELDRTSEREKQDLAMKQKEQDQEELEKLRKEEQARKEQEEYLKLKEAFVIEEVGEVGVLTEQESQQLLQDFIDYMVDQKVLPLEDLAAHFQLKVQDVIDRIEQLTEMGRLSGVMDDRGKYIYISEEELHDVAKFIRQRGRVSITDLAESSNQLIRMMPKMADRIDSGEAICVS